MAIISRIRKRSGLLVTLIGVAIVGFVLQDAFSRKNQTMPEFAKINGEKITYAQFEVKVNEITEQYKRAQGADIEITSEDMQQIRTMAWERLLNDLLIGEACLDLGLEVSSAELNDMYYGTFISDILRSYFTNPQTGIYDKQQVMMLINNFDQLSPEDKKSLNDLEKVVKAERLKEKFFTMFAGGFYVPTLIAENAFHTQMDVISANTVCFDYSSIPEDQVKVTDDDYVAYYEKNKHLFEQKASRAIDYVVFDILPTEQDMIKIEENANKVYEEFLAQNDVKDFVNTLSLVRFDSIYKNKADVGRVWDSLFFNSNAGTFFAPRRIQNTYQMAKLVSTQMRPDSVKASHILVSYKEAGSQTSRTKEQAKKLADSLRNVLVAAPSQFAMVASTYSEDPSVKQNGGDLSWQKDGFFIKSFNDAIINGNVGDFSVVETPNGYHILHITGKTTPVKKVMAAIISLPIEASSATVKAIFAEANNFVVKNRTLDQFNEAVKKDGLQKRTSEYTDALTASVPGVSNSRELVRWAFNEKIKEGEVCSDVFEIDNKYIVAVVREIRKDGLISFHKIKEIPQVEFRVKNEKRAEMVMTKIKDAQCSKLEDFAAKFNLRVDTVSGITFYANSLGGYGYEPEVIGGVFGSKQNVLSKPLKGNAGVFIVNVTNINRMENPENIEFVKTQMSSSFQNGMTASIRTALEKLGNIVDNRELYF